ncbi:MAG TPA: DUF4293 domain-containing protein [Chitinophagaceae bacterium]|nr:DUF4293 domain-containing protein [Chitinophagaceae bacterium]MCB9056244.1 DUF4293 domain-containing protein [Chitinophagales bacterium]HPG12167.1 DUF4293 domain-containing protein [Chitinophagaceae bacterium]HRX93436.1 DUF4293 domain-containing protein [Chitinophagaceae bacterium]
MIQRQQTLWLLLASAAAVLTFFFPFATGEEAVLNTDMVKTTEIIAGSNFFTLILTAVSAGLAFVIIFMFKDRKLQMRLTLLGILIAGITLALYILNMSKLTKATPALWAVLPAIVVISFFMAFRNIRKDEKLVRSLDKLR